MKLDHHSRHTVGVKGGEHVLVDAEMFAKMKESHTERVPEWMSTSAAFMGMPVFVDVCPCNADDYRFKEF